MNQAIRDIETLHKELAKTLQDLRAHIADSTDASVLHGLEETLDRALETLVDQERGTLDPILDRLCLRNPDAASVVEDLRGEREKLFALLRYRLTAACSNDRRADASVRVQEQGRQIADELVTSFSRHLQRVHQTVLPMAQLLLTPSDWVEIGTSNDESKKKRTST